MRATAGIIGGALAAALPAALIAAGLVFVATVVMNASALPAPAERLEAGIREAFATGSLPDRHVYDPDRRIGALTWNDCLILMMAMDPGRPRSEILVSPMIRTPNGTRTTSRDACRMLHDIVVEGRGDGFEPMPYQRYISAFAAPAALLVPRLGVAGYRTLLEILNYAAVLSILGACAFFALRTAEGPRRRKFLSGVVLFAGILVFGGMEFYAQGFGIGLADPFVYALFAVLLFGRPLRMARGRFIAVTAAAFALITAFEFWTGQLPLAFAGGVGLLALDMEDETDLALLPRRLADFAATALATVFLLFAIKIATAQLVFGGNILADFMGELELRAGSTDYGPFNLFLHLAGRADHIGQGSLVLGLLNGLAGTVALAVGARRLFRAGPGDPLARAAGLVLLVSVTLLAGWHLVFRNHSTIHSEFMVRSFVWWNAAGWIMLMLAGASGRASSADDQSSRGRAFVRKTSRS